MLQTFLTEITNTQKIFLLEDKNGIAYSESIFFNLEDGTPVPVICFWSNNENAENSKKVNWKNYEVVEICLVTFIEDFLVQLYNDSLIAGLNFNVEMEGYESDPLNLISAIIEKIKEQKLQLEFEYFKNIKDLENQMNKLK